MWIHGVREVGGARVSVERGRAKYGACNRKHITCTQQECTAHNKDGLVRMKVTLREWRRVIYRVHVAPP